MQFTGASTEGSTGGLPVKRSRQKQHNPTAYRSLRSYSVPRRSNAVTVSTPDIGSFFDHTKTKELASSPGEEDSVQRKMLKSDSVLIVLGCICIDMCLV